MLRAATIAEKMVKEVMGWALAMPPFASSLTGVIENILGRVQEAFSTNITRTLGSTVSGKHAQNQELALLMSLESDADLLSGAICNHQLETRTTLLLDPARFYITSPVESVDPSTCPAPFAPGSIENELAEREILAAVLNESPIATESLIARPGHFWRLVTLAALSESLDFVAKCICEIASHSDFVASPSSSGDGLRASITRQKKTHRQTSGSGNWDGLSTSLSIITDRYRSLSGDLPSKELPAML